MDGWCRVKGMFGVRQRDVRDCEMGQLIRSMGQHQLKFASLYGGHAPQVRGPFFFYVLTTHVPKPCSMGYKLACVLNIYFSPVQVETNHMTEIQNMRLFLGPIEWLRTITLSQSQSHAAVPLMFFASNA